jgi:hypothetical protein
MLSLTSMTRRNSDHHVRGRHERLSSEDASHLHLHQHLHQHENENEIGIGINANATSPPSIDIDVDIDIEAGVANNNGNINGNTNGNTNETFETNPIPDETTSLTNVNLNDTATINTNDSNAATNNNNNSSNNASNNSQQAESQQDSNINVSTPFDISNNNTNNTTAATNNNNNNINSSSHDDFINELNEMNLMNMDDININQNDIQTQLNELIAEQTVYITNTQTWFMIFLLLLFRLYIESFISADIGLFFISLISTSYLRRWRQWRLLKLERYELRITNLRTLSRVIHGTDSDTDDSDTDDNNNDNPEENDNNNNNNNNNPEENDPEMGQQENTRQIRQQQRRNRRRNRRLQREISRLEQQEQIHQRMNATTANPTTTTHLRHHNVELLSFQAHMALALMESQRLLQFVNDHSNNNNENGDDESRGVSDDKKQQWKAFEYTNEDEFYQQIQQSPTALAASTSTSASASTMKDSDEYEAPTCCICLCEYEKGDKLVQLQCSHAYHSACIESWCSNHVRCPLCNFDLDE